MLSLALIAACAPAAFAQVRVLYLNDLSLQSTATSALFLPQPVPGNQASDACGVYNEQPLSTVTADLEDQLSYLVFRGQLTNSSRVYLASGASAPALRFNRRQASCVAYSVGNGTTVSADCSASLPVLCTNSAPPYSSPDHVAPVEGSQVTASSTNASFTGFRDARSFRFLGIPFAEPPVGDLRFAAAKPYNRTYSNYSSLAVSASCLQPLAPAAVSLSGGYSEDCLYLNIYSPVLPAHGNGTRNAAKALPVAFYIYGGSFTAGSANIPEYDGGNMASRGDVVVVTINYRVGALGNLASLSLLNGSQGITDQTEALRWVRQHISAFGGDPEQVTIFGESAGGQSVLALLSSTPAKGLFSKAISESAPWNPFFDRQVYVDGVYPAILNSTNCTSSSNEADQVTCLQAVDSSSFYSNNTNNLVLSASVVAQNAYAQTPILVASVEPYLPTVGTGVIDGLPQNLIESGHLPAAGIPLMIGNMENEGTLFVDSVPQLASPVPASQATLDYLLTQSFDNSSLAAIVNNDNLFALNSTDPDALRDLLSQLLGLDTWQCPLQQVLGIAQQKNTFSALYSFRFDRGESQSLTGGIYPQACTNRSVSGIDEVCHGEDVPSVFGTNNVQGAPFDAGGLGFSQYVQDCWTAFIRTSNPQPSAAYLIARGAAYNTTLAYSRIASFDQYTGNSSTSVHVLDTPPRNSGPFFQDQCRVLANAGFLYDNVRA